MTWNEALLIVTYCQLTVFELLMLYMIYRIGKSLGWLGIIWRWLGGKR